MFQYDEPTGMLLKMRLDDSYLKHFGRGGLSQYNSRLSQVKYIHRNPAGNEYYYFRVTLLGKRYTSPVHHIVWFIKMGEWPDEIDHVDGDGLNNKIENLRKCSRLENNKNHRLQRNNSSGVNGVSYRKDTGKWRAFSYVSIPKRKQIVIGSFDNLFDAVCARKSFDLRNGFSGRHGERKTY